MAECMGLDFMYRQFLTTDIVGCGTWELYEWHADRWQQGNGWWVPTIPPSICPFKWCDVFIFVYHTRLAIYYNSNGRPLTNKGTSCWKMDRTDHITTRYSLCYRWLFPNRYLHISWKLVDSRPFICLGEFVNSKYFKYPYNRWLGFLYDELDNDFINSKYFYRYVFSCYVFHTCSRYRFNN